MRATTKLLFLTTLFLTTSVSKAEVVKVFSSQQNEHNVSYSSKYDRVVFARTSSHLNNGKIWQVKTNGKGNFESAVLLDLGPEQFQYFDPMISHDGHTLYFVSNMPMFQGNVAGDYNIWQATLIKDIWTQIKPLPFTINSEHDEMGPEMHNGVLYFSSSKTGVSSLYKAVRSDSKYTVSDFLPQTDTPTHRSDLTFSPDGKIALYLQSSLDKTNNQLMMMLKESGNWQQPIKAHQSLQLNSPNIKPQFSPDGSWLYYSNANSSLNFENLDIHKVESKNVFPTFWYERSLAPKALSVLAPADVWEGIKSFNYTFSIQNAKGIRAEEYWMSFAPFEMCKVSKGVTAWSNGTEGKEKTASGVKELDSKQIAALTRSARVNFIHMFKQPTTTLYQQYSVANEVGRVFRLKAQDINDFTVLLNEDLTEIAELRYDNGGLGLEYDYQEIDGVKWPMKFTFLREGKAVAEGAFSNLKFNAPRYCELK